MSTILATAFWTRCDTDGRDICRLLQSDRGWTLSGCASFIHQDAPCMLPYHVECDAEWRTVRAAVHGSVGSDPLDFEIQRTGDGTWLLNGQPQPAAGRSIDLDLGFTPATNLIAIRRLGTADGATVPAPAAYYLEFTLELGLVEQTYRRTGPRTLDYTSPAYDYAAELTVDPIGFVTEYPGLWSGRVYPA